jgi:hypothetical protein
MNLLVHLIWRIIKDELAVGYIDQRVFISSLDEIQCLASRLVNFIPALFCQQAEFISIACLDAVQKN